MRLVTAVGDVTGDGFPDLMAATQSGELRVYPSNGTSGFGKRLVRGRTPEGTDQVGVGRWAGDAAQTSALRRSDGTLWLLAQDGSLVKQLASGVGGRFDWVRGIGDLDGDKRADLVLRERTSGQLFMRPGRKGKFGPVRRLGVGLGGYDLG